MSKRYMDFAPRKSQPGQAGAKVGAGASTDARARVVRPAAEPQLSQRRSSASAVKIVTQPARKAVRPARAEVRPARGAVQSKPARVGVNTARRPMAGVVRTGESASASNMPKLGVVEDLNTKFVKTDVPKRPLNQAPEPNQATLVEAKAKKVGARRGLKRTKVTKPAETPKKRPDNTFKTPQSPFITNAKVEKRPLSGNVYAPKATTAAHGHPVKAEPKGPVAIIAKPEKESHVGIIVTIIITIILGAAAGTVAFLLLPK